MSTESVYTPVPASVIFITPAYLKSNTPLNKDVDDAIIYPAIVTAQDKHMYNILGSGVYADIKMQVSGNTLTALNQTLLNNYLQPIITWYALAELMPFLSFRMQNKGMEKKHSENSESASIDEIGYIQDRIESTAKSYAQMCINFLIRNNQDYPLYFNPDPATNVDTIYGMKTEYDCGLYIPDNLGNVYISNQDWRNMGLGFDVVFQPR